MRALLAAAVFACSAFAQFVPLQMSQQGTQPCNLAIVRVEVTASEGVYLERFSILGTLQTVLHTWFIRASDLPSTGWSSQKWVPSASGSITSQVPLILWLPQGTYFLVFAEGQFFYEPTTSPVTYSNAIARATTVQVGMCTGSFGGPYRSLFPPFASCAAATGNLRLLLEFATASSPRLLPMFGYITAAGHSRSGPCAQPPCDAVNAMTVLNARVGQTAEFPFYLRSFWTNHAPFVLFNIDPQVGCIDLSASVPGFASGNFLRLSGTMHALVGVPVAGGNISAFLPLPNVAAFAGRQAFYQGVALPTSASAQGLVGHLCVLQIAP